MPARGERIPQLTRRTAAAHGERQVYDGNYYESLHAAAEASAACVVPRLCTLVRPRTVVDVGCGRGVWLREFMRQNVTEVWGIDGPYVAPGSLQFPAERFLASDLSDGRLPALPVRSADLALCLEVAEHLPARAASALIASLTNLAPVVAFSGAVPGQGGECHINEQWPEYWAALFDACGYEPVDCLRAAIWHETGVAWWYRQNCLLFVRRSSPPPTPELAAVLGAVPAWPLSVVHPEQLALVRALQADLIEAVERPTLGRIAQSLPGAVMRSAIAWRRRLLTATRAHPADAGSGKTQGGCQRA